MFSSTEQFYYEVGDDSVEGDALRLSGHSHVSKVEDREKNLVRSQVGDSRNDNRMSPAFVRFFSPTSPLAAITNLTKSSLMSFVASEIN